MPTAAVNGQQLFFEDSGGDGPVVLLSHGYLMDHTMFDAQVAALAPEFRCVRWDERGFGQTSTDGAPFTYWDSADDAVGLLDHLGVDAAVLAGMSQGGFLSLRAALAHPDRVRGLVLIDTAADVDDDATLDSYRGMEAAWASPDTPDADHLGLRQLIGGLIIGDEAAAAPWVEAWGREPRERLTESFATLVGRDDISDRLGEITAPALVVHGEADAAISIDRARAMAAALPDVRAFVEVEGAAHAANLTHPDAVNAPLLEFLRSL